MKFQYYSSCLKSISLNLFLRIFGIIVFFLKIWQFTTSRTPPGAPCHLRPGVLPGKFPYRPVGTGTRSREIPVPAGGYGNSAGSSVTARGARLLPFRDTISNLCSNTPRPLKGSADLLAICFRHPRLPWAPPFATLSPTFALTRQDP